MPSPFALIGQIAIVPQCAEQVARLIEVLEPQGEEFIVVQDDLLIVYLDTAEAPYCYVHEANKAFADFCAAYATEAATFQTADVPMLVGPKPQLAKSAPKPIFPDVVPESKFEMSSFRPSDVMTYDLRVMH